MGLHANAAVVLQSTEVQEHDGGLGGQRGALRGRITLSKRRVRLLKTQLSVIRKHPEHPPTRIHLSDWRVGCVSPPHREGDVVGRTEKGMSSAVNAPPDAARRANRPSEAVLGLAPGAVPAAAAGACAGATSTTMPSPTTKSFGRESSFRESSGTAGKINFRQAQINFCHELSTNK